MAKLKTRDIIIEAAAQTFDRYGFRKTTMDDIALAAGKGKSSLYYYFKNKEEVFEAVVDAEAEHLKMEINKALSDTLSADEKLRTYIRMRMQRFALRGNLFTALNDNFLATFSFISKIRDKYRIYELETITEILKEGIQTGCFKPMRVEFIANALLTAMIGFEMPLLSDPNAGKEFDQKINDVLDMIFYGICT